MLVNKMGCENFCVAANRSYTFFVRSFGYALFVWRT